MNRKDKINNFLDYFTKKMTKEQNDYLNKINDVSSEKCEIYKNFMLHLFNKINDTYLGQDVISNKEYMVIHFNWCWKETIKDFKKKRFFFTEKGEHYYYILNYFITVYYNKQYGTLTTIEEFWCNLFSFSETKSKSDYDMFIELYKIFNKHFKIKN